MTKAKYFDGHRYLSVLLIAAAAFIFSGCGGHSHDNNGENHHHNTTEESAGMSQGNEYASKYVCPMHCEGSGSDQPGKCPVCGMEYVLNEEHQADGHTHDVDEGHDHD